MTYSMMSEDLQEMIWNTAASYVEGFEALEDFSDEQEAALDDLAEKFAAKAAEMGYDLDITAEEIEGLDDDETVAALTAIERALDLEGWKDHE